MKLLIVMVFIIIGVVFYYGNGKPELIRDEGGRDKVDEYKHYNDDPEKMSNDLIKAMSLHYNYGQVQDFNNQFYDISYDGLVGINTFQISQDENYFRYELEENVVDFKGVAAMTGRNGGMQEGGALLTLHMLSNQSFGIFSKTYAQSGHCPAPFFNQYAEQKVLLATSLAIQKKIVAWDLPNYQFSRLWEKFLIRGQCVKRLQYGRFDGYDVQIHDAYFANCRFILVNDLYRSPL